MNEKNDTSIGLNRDTFCSLLKAIQLRKLRRPEFGIANENFRGCYCLFRFFRYSAGEHPVSEEKAV